MVTPLNQENLNLIVEEIIEKVGRPVNVHVTRSVIESFGVRKIDVFNDYGFMTIEELSKHIHNRIINTLEKKSGKTKGNDIEYNTDYFSTRLKVFVKDYSLGLFHMLPIFLQVFTVIVFGYSLWTYSDFNSLQSTALVLGIINGFIFSGGIVTVISRQVSFYWNYKDYHMVFQSIVYLLKKGILILFVANAVLFAFSAMLGIFPLQMLLLSVTYSFFIGSALLFIAPLYILKRRLVITFAIFVGSLTALGLKTFSTLNTYSTHCMGILTVILMMLVYLVYYFKQKKIILKYNSKTIQEAYVFYHNFFHFC
jgi:hypothetical protein